MLSFMNLIDPLWWLMVVVGNFIVASIVIISISSIYSNSFTLKIFKQNILKVWLISLFADIFGVFYLLCVSLLCTNAAYYEGNNLFKLIESGIYLANNHSFFLSPFSVLFILSGILISAVASFLLNYIFSFSEDEITPGRKRILCIVLAITTAPYYIFLLENWITPWQM